MVSAIPSRARVILSKSGWVWNDRSICACVWRDCGMVFVLRRELPSDARTMGRGVSGLCCVCLVGRDRARIAVGEEKSAGEVRRGRAEMRDLRAIRVC